MRRVRRVIGIMAAGAVALGALPAGAQAAKQHRAKPRAESAGGATQCSVSSTSETGVATSGELASLLPDSSSSSSSCYMVGTNVGRYTLTVSIKGTGEVAAWGYDPDNAVTGSGGTASCSGVDSCQSATGVDVTDTHSSVYCFAAPYVAPGSTLGFAFAAAVNVTLTCKLTAI